MRRVAGQVFLLQVMVVVLVVAAAPAALVLQAREDGMADARQRSRDIAGTPVYAPDTPGSMTGPDPSGQLQPLAEKVTKETGADLVVVYSRDGVRCAGPTASGRRR
ncbi:hypothetical protein [Streptomyces thermoalcalitolerans]|uniref:Uncharacterized protein n=1 Tax=Streptomyces thermoalcalitolerans TaxID=65605 RepID=A0ABN1P2W9_9ACTN